MAPKMSVVVPVYNTGHYLDQCVDSLVGQSLSPDEYEIILVDDGSDDGPTLERLERAAAHPQVQVIHIPNSGWPGKPRNVGIDAATGEYVYFVDHDDWLAPEALQRMYDLAARNQADVIIGKIVGHGRRVAPTLFRRTYEKATVTTAPLMESLTPHKGFRRAFLNGIGLRFPEGKRRLEDHVFIVEAYLRAGVISVLSDYTCYHHIARDDGQNAGFAPFDPKGYYANLREAVLVAEKYTEPGQVRDTVLRRWFRVEMLRRVGGKTLLSMEDDYRDTLVKEVRRLARRHFRRPSIVEPLAANLRARAELLRTRGARGRRALLALAEYEVGLALEATLEDIEWVDDALEVTLRGRVLAPDGDPFLAATEDAQEARFPVPGLSRVWWRTRRGTPLRLTVVAHRRGSTVDRLLTAQADVVPGDRGTGETYRATFRIDPVGQEEDLTDGAWDLTLRCQHWLEGAQMLRARIPWPDTPTAPTVPGSRVLGTEGRAIRPYRTKNDNLSIEVRTDSTGPEPA